MTGCFISYRRDDSAPWAGRLHDRLAASLDTWRIFFDIDSVDLGQDFRTVIASTLESCDVVLVLIGPTWLSKDEGGGRRIDDESDVHRVEVTTALNSGLRVIPILVGGAAMPRSSELPGDLQSLAFRNALTVDHGSFTRDVEVLERALRRIEPGEPSGARAPPEPVATPSALVAPGESDLPPVGAEPPTATPAPVHSASPPAAVVVPVVRVAAAPACEATRGARPDDIPSRAPTPPVPPQDTSSARGRRLAVIVALAAVVLIGTAVVATRDGDSPATTASAATTSIDTGTPDSAALTPGAAATTVPEVQTSVVLPADTDIFQQPVDVAVERLQSAGLAVSQNTSGCSNSTEPGLVRQVTLGSELNTHILYGKSTDDIDDAAALALRPGDEVTVWTPTANPC